MSAPTRPALMAALAAVAVPSPDPGTCRLLGLPVPSDAGAHTSVFVLETHPYASVHLGEEGMIGGDAGDRVAGFWRTLGMVPPKEPDHLRMLLELYARLGSEELACVPGRRRDALRSARAALCWEHLAPWALVHLASVARVGDEFHRAWAMLVAEVLVAEADALMARAELPTALAAAPPPLDPASSRAAFLDALLAPVRTGIVLCRADLVRAGDALGLGVRRGERRFSLDALIDQDPGGVLAWLGAEAHDWADRHLAWHTGALEEVGRWWAERARTSAAVLTRAAQRAA